MRSIPRFLPRLLVLISLMFVLAACSSSRTRGPVVQAANIPSAFDITLLAEKDNQFDYQDAPLTVEDLKSALRYRKEESLPMSTVLLKRGEKQRVTKTHISNLVAIGQEMGFTAYLLEKSGRIAELQAR